MYVVAKADTSGSGGLPAIPDHLHLHLPDGRKVHPMSPEGVEHLHQTVTDPADAHTRTMIGHLHGLMHGLDVDVKGRAKEAKSLAEKVVRKSRPAHKMGDLIGTRITVNNPAHFAEAQRRLQAHMRGQHPMSGHDGVHIDSEEDNCKTPMSSGYRSVHYNARVHGMGAEIQLRHPHHTTWADWCHDNFYKDHALKAKLGESGHSHELEAVKAAGSHYAKAVADHLDATHGRRGKDAPEAPPILKKHGLEFPWHKLD